MRIPAGLLNFEVQVQKATQNTAEGTTLADPVAVRCQYEEKAQLKLDERTDSDTFGEMIVMSTRIITQVEDWLPVGTAVTTVFGNLVTVANSSRYPAVQAPANAEMWCV